jgi:2-methylaconitate cis-trans-isomerase PrpF
MKLIEWEVNEDSYQEQIVIPETQRKLAENEGISTENKQKVAVRIQNLNTGEMYCARVAITGNHQLYLPAEIQKMLEGAGSIRIQLV